MIRILAAPQSRGAPPQSRGRARAALPGPDEPPPQYLAVPTQHAEPTPFRPQKLRKVMPSSSDNGACEKSEWLQPPPWAEVSSSSDVAACWWQALEEFGVDDFAKKGLFGLAQSSDAGRSAAFGIMAKLWKKASDGETIDKPSAFVWTCVKKTWDKAGWS